MLFLLLLLLLLVKGELFKKALSEAESLGESASQSAKPFINCQDCYRLSSSMGEEIIFISKKTKGIVHLSMKMVLLVRHYYCGQLQACRWQQSLLVWLMGL